MIGVCPACQASACSHRMVKDGWVIRSCRACGTWFVANPPSAEQLRDLYGAAYFTERLAQHSEDDLRAIAWRSAVGNARERLALIRRYAPRARRLLDVGCGTGAFLHVAREAAYDCCGVDVSSEAVAVVRGRLGIEAHAGDLASLSLPSASFDVITLFDVVEHVPNPFQIAAEVCRLLVPGGAALLTTGDTDSLICRLSGRWWHLMTPPEHLTYFSRRGLARMMEAAGLSMRHSWHKPVTANIGYMAGKLAVVAGAPLSWLPRFVASCGLAERDVAVNLLDVVTMLARKA